jgi:hypothetical protein
MAFYGPDALRSTTGTAQLHRADGRRADFAPATETLDGWKAPGSDGSEAPHYKVFGCVVTAFDIGSPL